MCSSPQPAAASRFALLVLVTLALCHGGHGGSASHGGHACARVAETQAGRPFVSVCAGGGHAALHEARLFVCLPLASSQQPPPRPGLDVLSRTLSPDAFVGQLQLQGAPAGDAKYALDFEEAPSLARPASGPAYACARAVAVGLEPGNYSAFVVHEYAGWAWDADWEPPRDDLQGPVFGEARGEVSVGRTELPLVEGWLTVLGSGSEARRRSLPECTTEELHGTFRGGVFLPTHCTRREVSYEQFDGCMARIGGRVALMGESNSRRALKRLFSRGAWCGEPGAAELSYCNCEDFGWEDCVEPGLPQGWKAVAKHGLAFSNGSSFSYEAFGGFPYNANFFGSPTPAAVAVVGYLGAWPEASSNASQNVAGLAATIDLLLTLPPTTRFVFRTAPYFCCFAGRYHRFSEKRQRLFSRMLRDAMLGAFPGRAYFWDTRSLSEPRSMSEIGERAGSCRSNHLPSPLVAEDLRTLMSLLCVISEGG